MAKSVQLTRAQAILLVVIVVALILLIAAVTSLRLLPPLPFP